MLTFAQLKTNPELLAPFQWLEKVEVVCSREECSAVFSKRKVHILKALATGRDSFFCSRACVNHARLEGAIEVRDGMKGRVCTACKAWKRLAEMDAKGRARICMRCKRQTPDQVFWTTRSKAKFKGWEFSLTREQFDALVGRPCFYCDASSSGLDRQDPSKGYVPENVVPCCPQCNFGKSDASVSEFIGHCRKIAEFNQSYRTK